MHVVSKKYFFKIFWNSEMNASQFLENIEEYFLVAGFVIEISICPGYWLLMIHELNIIIIIVGITTCLEEEYIMCNYLSIYSHLM